MIIEKNLPFEICENCEHFVVDCDEQVIFMGDKPGHRVLKVGCKNAWLCRQLKNNMEGKNDDGSV